MPPLSPIFALTIESFLCKARASEDIRGIEIGGREHRVAVFADALLFFISTPELTLPNLLREITEYGKISNFHVNRQKLEINISIPSQRWRGLTLNFTFQETDAIPYFGTFLPRQIKQIFSLNFTPLLTEIERDLKDWSRGLRTWTVRCNTVY